MSREENLMILRMLQDGTITAEQAAALLQSVDTRPAVADAPDPSAGPEISSDGAETGSSVESNASAPVSEPSIESEAISRARAKIAAAREKVAGVQEQLAAAEEKIDAAEGSANPLGGLTDALRDLPGMRGMMDAFKGIDAGRLASDARKQARRLGKTLRDSLDAIPRDLGTIGVPAGEPDFRVGLEGVAALEAGGTLRVRNPLGAIEIVGAEVPECRVAATVDAWGPDLEAVRLLAESVHLGVDATSDGVVVAITGPESVKRLRCDVKVFVPSQACRMSAVSPAGDITVRGVRGPGMVLASVSGGIHVAECAGDVTTETTSGETTLQGVDGLVVARSTSGDIKAMRLAGERANIRSQSGDIDVRNAEGVALDMETVSGDVVASEVSGVLQVRTVSGDVRAAAAGRWDAQVRTVSGNVALGGVADATGSVDVEAVSGDIRVEFAQGASGAFDARTRSGRLQGLLPGGIAVGAAAENAATDPVSFGDGDGVRWLLRSLSGDVVAVVSET